MQSAYQLEYVEFLKLREKYKQQVLELNSLRTEKTSMLIKINDLEERLLETQLQLERVSDENLTHMLSILKCPTDKTGLWYVPTSDTPTSKTIFVKSVIPDIPPPKVDKGKAVLETGVRVIPQPPAKLSPAKLPIRRKPLTCHHCDEPGHIRLNCQHRQVQRKKKWQALKTPMCHQCGASSHVRPRCPPLKPSKHPKSPPRNQVPKHQQLQKPTQAKKTWVPKKTTEREISDEGTPSASSFMQDLVRFLALQLKNEGHDKDEDTHSLKGSRPTK
jgi:uncharacterized protein YbaR (Trm112 family)